MVPFVYLASVCRSLQCLISALTQVGGGGLLLRFACSVVLWGGRGTADKCHWRVWGVLAVFRPHWVCPCSRCVLSPSTLLRLQVALQGAGWSCVHFPRLSCSFRFSGTPQRRRLLGAASCAFPVRAAQATRSLTSALSSGAVRLLSSPVPASVSGHARSGEPCVSSAELISGCDPPGGCQPSRISGSLWLKTGSLFAVW